MTIGRTSTATMLEYHTDKFRRAPKGFRKIGEGAYRTAYLEQATGLVYKIGDSSTNESEYENWKRVRSLPKFPHAPVKLPTTRLVKVDDYRKVIIQTLVRGRKTTCRCHPWYCSCDMYMLRNRLQLWSGVNDLHGGNVLVDDKGVYWIIDIAGEFDIYC